MSYSSGEHCVFSAGGFAEPPLIEEVEFRQLASPGALVRQRLTSTEWRAECANEMGISEATFYKLRRPLEKGQKVLKSAVGKKWAQIRKDSQNSKHEIDQ